VTFSLQICVVASVNQTVVTDEISAVVIDLRVPLSPQIRDDVKLALQISDVVRDVVTALLSPKPQRYILNPNP